MKSKEDYPKYLASYSQIREGYYQIRVFRLACRKTDLRNRVFPWKSPARTSRETQMPTRFLSGNKRHCKTKLPSGKDGSV